MKKYTPNNTAEHCPFNERPRSFPFARCKDGSVGYGAKQGESTRRKESLNLSQKSALTDRLIERKQNEGKTLHSR